MPRRNKCSVILVRQRKIFNVMLYFSAGICYNKTVYAQNIELLKYAVIKRRTKEETDAERVYGT